MSQTTEIQIQNQNGLAFRTKLNEMLSALNTDFSGSIAPTVTEAGMVWLDTSASPYILRRRNDSDSGWDVHPVQQAVITLDSVSTKKTSSTGSTILPVGTTAQRDGSPTVGYLRYNTSLSQFEGYGAGGWGKVGGGATGGGANSVFYLNDQTVTQDYSIPSGQNAMTAGPITIASGVTVTVPSGSVWTVV